MFIQNWNPGTQLVTGVTFNGNAMTSIANLTGSSNGHAQIAYYIAGANAAGTHDVVISASSSNDMWAEVVSYSGTATDSTAVDTTNAALNSNPSNSTITSSVTTPSTSGCWVVWGIQTNGNNITSVSNGAIREDSQGYFGSADSNGTVTASSTYSTITTTQPNSANWVQMISIVPAGAAPSVNSGFFFAAAS